MQFQAQLPTTCLCHTVLFIMLRTHSCRGLLSSHTSRLSLDLSSARVRHLLRTMWCHVSRVTCHVSRVTITCARRSAGAWPRCSPSSGCRCAPPRGTASPAPPAPRAPAPSPGSCQSETDVTSSISTNHSSPVVPAQLPGTGQQPQLGATPTLTRPHPRPLVVVQLTASNTFCHIIYIYKKS